MFKRNHIEVLDFNEFLEGRHVVKNKKNKIDKKEICKNTLKVGAVVAFSTLVFPVPLALAKTGNEDTGSAFDNLIDGLLGILDPAAKIFGMIAGLAIMTGNGKIGLERLFWLSLGYITSRKVETWINWLNTI